MLFEFLCRLVSHPCCMVSMLSEFLFHLLPLPFCMGLYSVQFSMSPPVCIGLYVVRVSMSLGLTPVLYGSLCCPSFYVTWSHPRSVWVSILSDFLCHLISLPFCMYIYVVRVSMSLGLTSVMYGSLCFPGFYVT